MIDGIAKRTLVWAAAASALAGCRLDMHDQPYCEPFEPCAAFGEQATERAPLAGTIARGQLAEDPHLSRGQVDGELATTLPMPVTSALLTRGRQRYDIYCAPCHARTGTGNGLATQRGSRLPPSFHTERLRQAPVGHFFDVATRGFGAMLPYGGRVSADDRWAIAAYVRTLQYSQFAPLEALSPSDRAQLEGSGSDDAEADAPDAPGSDAPGPNVESSP